MFKSIVPFFRKQEIKKFLLQKRYPIFPDITKSPTVTVLLDENQKKQLKNISMYIKELFKTRRYCSIIYNKVFPNDIMQSYYRFFIVKNDFNIFGVLKKKKKTFLKEWFSDIFVNLSTARDDSLLYEYIMTYIKSSFRVGFSEKEVQFYDLVINSKKDDTIIDQLKNLQRYLLILSGNNNEK